LQQGKVDAETCDATLRPALHGPCVALAFASKFRGTAVASRRLA
jgi:hypothetical protein